MACTLQTDSDQWLALMGADPVLRQCLEDVFGSINAQITLDVFSQIDILIAQMGGYLNRLIDELSLIFNESACVQVIIDAMIALPFPTSETVALKNDMIARKLALQAQMIELQATIAVLPAEITKQLAIKEELVCQKANAEFFMELV